MKVFKILCFLCSIYLSAQTPYPQDYFRSPLDIQLVLSGTFAELRSNHFHSGLDIKTNGKQGLKVYAAAQGYVSRIKISRYGYGKALYITHPNGYTTVYAHLQKFSPEIEAYIKKQQYQKEQFEIELFPKLNALKIESDALVAFSGNTGGSSGPHLHFEIRDKQERPMNPMLFGLDIKDTTAPELYELYAYPISENSHIDGVQKKKKIRLIKQPDGSFVAEAIKCFGEIGFGIVANDRQDYAPNKNGVSKIETYFNGQKSINIDFKRFSFSETKHINRFIDYAHYRAKKRKIQKLFIEKNNPLSLFTFEEQKGKLNIKDSANYSYLIKIKDFKNNFTSVRVPILGEFQNIKKVDSIPLNYTFINASEVGVFEEKSIRVEIPAHTLYDDTYLDIEVKNDTLKLHRPNIPLKKSMTITFDVSHYEPDDMEHLYIASVSAYGKLYYTSTKRKGSTLSARTKYFGTYTLATDKEGPKITPSNFKNESWLSNYRYLKIKISDEISGVKNFRATVNGKWILMEYDSKTNTLTHDFNDGVVNDTKNNLKLIVTDNVGNSSKFESVFYRN
ncbi:MAG: M23 family metallopeptidase [Flavobacteriaceae bacterium]